MHYVKPTPQVIGPAGHTPLDGERRTRLPADKWRPIPGPTSRWARLAVEGSVYLVEAEIIAAGTKPPQKAVVEPSGIVVMPDGKRMVREEEIEGYEPPAKEAAGADTKAGE